MLALESHVRVWLYTPPTDMRKSFDGLAAIVKQRLLEDPLSGAWFVFVNRRQTQMKVLFFDRSGYCLWSKRLEQGTFPVGDLHAGKRALCLTDLQLMIEGKEVQLVKQRKRYRHALSV